MNENEIILKLAEEALKARQPDYLGDLVKIGLPIIGVVLGGLIGFFTSKASAKQNHQTQLSIATLSRETELEKEYYARRAKRIDETIDCLDGFNQLVINYCTFVKNWLDHKKNNNHSKAEETQEEISASQKKLYSEFLSLLNSESKLLVLGLSELQKALRDFGEFCQSIYQDIHIEKEGITVEKIDEQLKILKRKREDLYFMIGEHEKREHNKRIRPTIIAETDLKL